MFPLTPTPTQDTVCPGSGAGAPWEAPNMEVLCPC